MPRHHSAYHRFYGYGAEKNEFSPFSHEVQKSKEEEKDQMKHLNNRLVSYVDKVHDLEIANRVLSADNERLKRQARDSDHTVPGMYENEMTRLRARIEDLEVYSKRVEIERDNIRFDYEEADSKYRSEKSLAEDLERDVKHLRKDVDDATLERAKLETKLENTMESLALEKQVHETEMENLRDQLQPLEESVFSAEQPGILPDLNDAIINVRKQYEDFNSKSLEDLDGYYKDKVNHLIKQLKSSQDDARQQRLEAAEKQKIIIRLERELEALRGVNKGLEKSIEDLNVRLERESAENQELVNKIHHELDDTKEDLGKYLKDYQKLHGLKMSLEQEIAIYQKVLAGEEARISEIDTNYRGRDSTISSHHSSGRASPALDRKEIVDRMLEEHHD